ncbi:hypothetical protein BSKO_03595 [Bryopsis sp. KO-2023]|nr:hypothetical protein BSKO_03595 [Bryopsis sp. KO-2023]
MTPSVCAPNLLRSTTNSHVARLDARNGQSRGARTSALASERASSVQEPVVVHVPPPRVSTSPPRPVPVIHSPAYLYQMGVTELKSEEGIEESDTRESVFSSRPAGKVMSSGNPFEQALASADNMLNNLEQNPDPATQAIWKATNSSAGQTAAKGVRGAAEFTVQAGTQAVKMAAPIGAWAVQQGLRVALDMMSQSSKKDKQSKNSKSNSDSN